MRKTKFRFEVVLGALVALPLGCAQPLTTTTRGTGSDDTGGTTNSVRQSRCGSDGVYEPRVVVAVAPTGTGNHMLGRPLGTRFNSLVGPGADSLFDKSKIRETVTNTSEHRVVDIDDNASFDAHFDAWKLGGSRGRGEVDADTTLTDDDKKKAEELDADTTEEKLKADGLVGPAVSTLGGEQPSTAASTTEGTTADEPKRPIDAGFKFRFASFNNERYLAYQATQTVKVVEIDDFNYMREPPEAADWYVAKIHYGQSYEVLLSGSKEKFDLGLKIRFKRASEDKEGKDESGLGLNFGFRSFKDDHELSLQSFQRGLVPRNGDAIFARSEGDIQANYAINSQQPVAIMVEYRSIEKCDNASAPANDFVGVEVNFDKIQVLKAGDDTWNLSARCTVNDSTVTLSNPVVWNGQTPICDRQSSQDYCEYDLSYSTMVEASPGDVVKCGVSGDAAPARHLVDYAPFTYTVGAPGDTQEDSVTIGNANTEYRMFYRVRSVGR